MCAESDCSVFVKSGIWMKTGAVDSGKPNSNPTLTPAQTQDNPDRV